MEPIFVDVIRLTVCCPNGTTQRIYVSKSTLEKADPNLVHCDKFNLQDVPSYEIFFKFLQGEQISINQQNQEDICKTAETFGLPLLKKFILENPDQTEITISAYKYYSQELDAFDFDDSNKIIPNGLNEENAYNDDSARINIVGALQEYCMQKGFAHPVYKEKLIDGRFKVECTIRT